VTQEASVGKMVANVGYGRRKKKSGEVREKKNDGCSRRRGGGVAITGLA